MNHKEHVIELSGKKYQYFDIGEGSRTVLFLHGLAGNKTGAPDFTAELLKDFRCLYLDLPAHGNLPLYDLKDIDSMSDYLVDFVKHHKLSKVGLVGFSFGGVLALRTAQKLKAHNIESAAVPWAAPLRINKSSVSGKADMCIQFLGFLPEKMYKKVISSQSVLSLFAKMGVKLSDADKKALSGFDNKSMPVFKRILNKKFEVDPDITTLFVYGTNDIFVKPELFGEIDPGSKHKKVLIENGGHFGTKEGRSKALKEIKDFLNSYFPPMN